MAEQFKNEPAGGHQSTLQNSILANATSLQVVSAVKFSTTGTFRILVGDDENDPDAELYIVTAVAGAVFTVTPGAEGTTSVAHPAGSKVYQVLTVAGLRAAGVGDSSPTELLFNNAGVVDGSADLTWDGTMFQAQGTTTVANSNRRKGQFFLFLNPATDFAATDAVALLSGVRTTDDCTANFGVGTYLEGLYNYAYHGGSGSVQNLYGAYFDTENFGGGPVVNMVSLYPYMYADSSSPVTNGYGAWVWLGDIPGGSTVFTKLYGYSFTPPGAGSVTTAYVYHSDDLAGRATNGYYAWFDSQGVYRIREDAVADGASFPQAVMALYNPRFTKYTPGATDHERVVQQWAANVLQYGTEKGGSGTLRKMQLIGAGLLLGTDILPTSDPGIPGQLYRTGGDLRVSL